MKSLSEDIKEYRPAIRLTNVMGRRALSICRKLLFVLATLCGIGVIVSHLFFDAIYTNYLWGGGFIFVALWLEQMLSYSYHNSYYFRGLNSLIGIDEEGLGEVATYDVAEVALSNEKDLTKAFCGSGIGLEILLRSGLTQELIRDYLNSQRARVTSDNISLPKDEIFSLIGLGKYLLTHDPSFNNFLRSHGVREEIFIGSLRWIVGNQHQVKRGQRWWSKDNLSRTTGIGHEWSYGTAYLLNKFSRDIITSTVFSTLGADSTFAAEKVVEIESALARAQTSNVLIIGEAGVGKMDLVMEVSRRMKLGQSLDAISGRQITVLDTTRIFATHKDKQGFEFTILKMLDEATRAGNNIIVIENISVFIKEAEGLGVFLPELIDQYLAVPQLQFIATDTPGAYHNHLETYGAFTRRFSEVSIDTPDLSATTRLLEDIALRTERRSKVLFTYAALNAVTTSADRYIVEGVMPDKAIQLLTDVVGAATQEGKQIISDEFVYETVSTKTGVPAGPIGEEEKDTLLNLEDKLHQQVVGQQAALSAIARTMRRARAGIQSADKPIGSFLFLGPTGVGKTETAKALANIFFGGEDKMQRIDMSEFSGNDALERLVGNGDQAGVLPNMLREHPYSVILLDEFEKADRPVHDVFLQILDEGMFTDARGAQINARNSIIIATSNAGSKLILKTVQQRKDLSHLSQEIINKIIEDGVYRPELINRFDSTIIFEPLSVGEQTEVASLMLGGLYKRVKERGYDLKVSEDLLSVLVEKGYNPEFGARPMQRVLQDVIEEKVAQKIIAGSVQKGDTINLQKADFTHKELSV